MKVSTFSRAALLVCGLAGALTSCNQDETSEVIPSSEVTASHTDTEGPSIALSHPMPEQIEVGRFLRVEAKILAPARLASIELLINNQPVVAQREYYGGETSDAVSISYFVTARQLGQPLTMQLRVTDVQGQIAEETATIEVIARQLPQATINTERVR